MNSFQRRNNRVKRKWNSIRQLYFTANFAQVKTEIPPPNGSFHDSVAVDDDLCFSVVTHQRAGLFWTAIFPAVLIGIRKVIVLILWFSNGVREALCFAGVGIQGQQQIAIPEIDYRIFLPRLASRYYASQYIPTIAGRANTSGILGA